MSQLDAIFNAYDIRGVMPDELEVDIAGKVGPAFAAFGGAGPCAEHPAGVLPLIKEHG